MLDDEFGATKMSKAYYASNDRNKYGDIVRTNSYRGKNAHIHNCLVHVQYSKALMILHNGSFSAIPNGVEQLIFAFFV